MFEYIFVTQQCVRVSFIGRIGLSRMHARACCVLASSPMAPTSRAPALSCSLHPSPASLQRPPATQETHTHTHTLTHTHQPVQPSRRPAHAGPPPLMNSPGMRREEEPGSRRTPRSFRTRSGQGERPVLECVRASLGGIMRTESRAWWEMRGSRGRSGAKTPETRMYKHTHTHTRRIADTSHLTRCRAWW